MSIFKELVSLWNDYNKVTTFYWICCKKNEQKNPFE